MIILHGDNTVQSRQKLVELLTAAKQHHQTILKLTATKLDLPQLETALMANSLFDTPKVVVIEELHSLPRSQKRTQLIQYLAKTKLANPESLVILWEKRALTATMKKQFPQAQTQEFKTSNTLFKWLDSVNGQKRNIVSQLNYLQRAIHSDGEFMCLAMLTRQIRLLIQTKDGGVIKRSPFCD